MRRLAPLVVAASTLSCSSPQNVAEQFVPPAPMPRTMRALSFVTSAGRKCRMSALYLSLVPQVMVIS